MPSSPPRFRDPGLGTYAYLRHGALVECPRCAGAAEIKSRKTELAGRPRPLPRYEAWKLVCANCKHFAEWTGRVPWPTRRTHERQGSGFGLPLWLRTQCRGHTLWAYNPRHLRDLAAFIEALHREHGRDPARGMSSRTMAASLPRWIVLGKNRPEAMRGIGRLRRRLERVRK